MKRRYELTVIISPQLTSTELTKTLKKIETLISKLKGKVVKKEDWGSKDLATPIEKETKATYSHFILELPTEAISQLEKEFKLTSGLLRYLLIQSEK